MRILSYLANPARFLRFSRFATPISGWLALGFMSVGLIYALFLSPPAVEHGEAVRMMYVHVPASWCAMAAYAGIVYIAYMAIWNISADRRQASRLAAILAMVGALNLPIIKFSVNWWNTLHQPATLSEPGAPGLPVELLTPLLLMTLAYTFLLAWFTLRGTEAELIALKQQRAKQTRPATVTLEDVSS